MNITFQPYLSTNTNFKAIPLAKYGYLNDKAKDVIVYQLEKKDIDYLKNFQRILKNSIKNTK